MPNNIFSALISVLNSIRVSGEDDMRKMLDVIGMLRQMERSANRKEETEDG